MTEKELCCGCLASLAACVLRPSPLTRCWKSSTSTSKKAQEPDNEQNKRLDEMDKRIGTLEQGQLQHTQALARDLRRFEESTR